jgi:hypothetical protein
VYVVFVQIFEDNECLFHFHGTNGDRPAFYRVQQNDHATIEGLLR